MPIRIDAVKDVGWLDGRYLKLGGDNADQNINIGSYDFTTTGAITVSSILALTDLYLQSTATGNVELFNVTDVGNDVDGKSLFIRRMAAEGDKYIRIRINDEKEAEFITTADAYWLQTSGKVWYFSDTALAKTFGITGSTAGDYANFSVSDAFGNQFVLTNDVNSSKDHDHDAQANPTLYIHSDSNPDTNNTEWGSLAHTGTGTGNGVFSILSGTGEISFGDENIVTTGTHSATGGYTGALTGNASTASNLSGTPALPNGTEATTQAAADNSLKLATTAYADTAAAGGGATAALDNLASVAINETLVSDTYNTDALGTTAIAWSDLFLGTGSVIEWSSAASTSDLTLTHSANTLTFAGGTIVLGTATAAGGLTGNVTGDASGSSGSCTGNSATATEATNITAVANNSTDETVYPTFVDGATGTQGIETDTGLTYNPSSGLLTSIGFAGELTGNAGTVTNGVYTTDNLSVMSATTSEQFIGVISDETGTGKVCFATAPTFTTSILTPSILSAAGLTLLPTATGDVELFGDTDVGNDAHGKGLIIHRKATEGDVSLKLYGNSDKSMVIEGNDRILEFQQWSSVYLVSTGGNVKIGSNWMGAENPAFTQFGYITADTDEKYIQWQVEDTTDYFALTREDAFVLGFKIDMPALITDKLSFTQTDLNEYIDSDGDGYLDLHATTTVDINAPLLCIPSKSDTGDPTAKEGGIYINRTDNVVKIYADGAWRTLATWI